jgi:signal transduction histidine kinase
MLVRAAPLRREGLVYGAVAAYVDITDLVRIQDELVSASRVKDDFLAMVSHELRTPMTMILGNAQLLSRGTEAFSEDERDNLAAEVYRESVSLSRIVDNLLLMTRLDHGERLELEPVVLRHICKKVVEEVALEAVRCHLTAANQRTVVMANPTSVEQILRNLISNALKYGQPNTTVDLSLYDRGDEVVFSVADRGPGIDAADRERIFEPFFRAKSTATRSGMGIGLAVSKRLVDTMGGRIWAKNRAGGGSEFCVALPRLDASDS